MDYVNEKCAACGGAFTKEDDVVVCPECGSPHHRECYIEDGKCANSAKHGEFIWKPAEKKNKTIVIPVVPENRFQNPVISEFGISPTENIFGISADQAAAFVSSNVTYYLPRFIMIKESGKNGFNPLCFIYPAGFFASRKMWFWAFVSVLINMVLAIPSMITLLAGLGGDTSTLTPEVSSFVYNNRQIIDLLNETSNMLYLAVCLIFALLANRMYLNFTVKSVKRLKEVHGRRLTRTILRRAGGISNLNLIAISVILLIALLLLMGATIIVLEQLAM